MGLEPGSRLGPYEVASPIGAGGMGEVYRARDIRLDRDVAVKVLPPAYAADAERLRRFQQEARAAGALNHPNVLAVFDVGTHEGAPFLVTELLDGETLRDRLRGGPLPVRKALEIARDIAGGLAAAHAKGIVHRDLKPENLFLTRDGRVKILDFGIAKLTRADAAADGGPAVTRSLTESGVIVGTVGYMAPEQVRGEAVDHRADLFALGCVLHEMLAGTRAFGGAGTVETLHAILHEEPAPLSDLRSEVSPALSAVVQHCLEKDPALRFQSARDAAFALGSLTGAGGTTRVSSTGSAAARRRRRLAWTAGAVALAIVVAVAGAITLRPGHRVEPTFERLTFRRGSLSGARFSPDGQTVVYSAAWDGEPTRVYSTRLDSRESSALPLPDARLLSISPTGDLAITVGPGTWFGAGDHTTLATVPLAGGAPREMAEDVSEADWSPGDRQLAVVRRGTNRMTLSLAGREIWRTTSGIINPRVSPRGDLIAFVELASRSDFDRGYVAIVDRAGHARRLTGLWETIHGIAWGPRGDEVWFTAVHQGHAKALWAVNLAGRERLLLSTPGGITLLDVARNGHALVSQDNMRMSLLALPPGETRERDLSWQDVTGLADLSADGRRLVFTEYSEAYGREPAIGMRGTDGSPVVHLGDGYAGGLSPDGRWVVAMVYVPRPHLSLLPTGAGQARDLDPGPVRDFDWSCWAPDGGHVLFGGIETGHGTRSYVQDVTGGPPRAFTPDGASGYWRLVSPDSRYLLGGIQDSLVLFPLDGSGPRHVPSMPPGDNAIGWLPDGRSLLVSGPRNSLPVRVQRMDLATGERRRVCELMPSDPAGVSEIVQIIFTPDTRSWAYSYRRTLSDLYLVRGLN